jgi:uncharacterized membrane protein YhiD involved in acid resistance
VWVNAALGVAAGGGEYHLALIATGVTVVVLLVLVPIERLIDRFAVRKGFADPNQGAQGADPARRD